ncbi:RICIN domain-containing protein [Actinokineospora globicatena]|uniref:Ricin B lectin domain-containing protein n=1 Tax=Actinokineospora globicatena TaxID=103729 RepID=A0A9W6V8Y0_9PSEU|nr:ricin-type beta-trefoil lectin domain protein [Actinokineospora globicatena]MCP2303071.1 Ricin-type beta-trefoil lectin domain-containing protein [Actinokineospora globicatena]GLW79816.1 hypothetical protein Aglo01_42970 [Actinokineospora globicatena]GLW85774.1 hypothetical protein Aglo02_34140 [Actinokineospora globicatena]GLW90441.1 hypothetical protein Aglo03_12570 [Actinokineospora globicatena]
MKRTLKTIIAGAAAALSLLALLPAGASAAATPPSPLPPGTAITAATLAAAGPAAVYHVRIRSLYGNGNQCLDADATAGGNGTKVQLWDCNGSTQQTWILYSSYNDFTNLRFGRCLDADLNGGGANGTKLQLWDCNNTTQQDWYQYSGDQAIYNGRFYNNRNTVLDRDITQAGNGAKAQLWAKNFQSQQWWVIEIV